MTFRELCRRQVIQLETGAYLGRVDDLEFDPKDAKICRLVLLGRPRLFGLLGREESLFIPWSEVSRFGVDALLVTTPLPEGANTEPHRSFWREWLQI